MDLMDSMEIRSSHVFREWNVPADILSIVALEYDGFRWWDAAIPEIYGAVYDDRRGERKYRLR